ncbi:MAG TPA: PQQ-binding-like beta-propeller repeat protein [Pirellulales bacterium]|nr:PQQ-binding-like beta-propeller repeat protein [Pirellulales bacterium]
MNRTIFLFLLCLSVATIGRAAEGNNWPQLRGAKSLGLPESESANLPDTWSTTESVLWKTDLAGRGWSSPVVWGDKVFLSTVVNLGESEAPKKGLYFGGDRPKPSEAVHQWKVYCLDLKSGTVLWDRTVHEGPPQSSIHLKNSYASETPVTDGRHVYVYFGNVGLYCLDLEGKEVWSQKWAPHKTRLGWGTAASPVLYKDRLYVVNDNEEESYLVCLDAATGEQIWRVERDEKSNWATPFIWENELRTEIITPGTGKVRSYDLDGNLLYEFGGMSSITIAVPYAKDGLLYVSSGYVMDKKKPLMALKPGAVGDISLADDQTSNEYIVWCQKDGAPYNPTSIIYKGLLYVLYDRGFLSCYDARTGEMVYDKQRLPEGKAFTSSPWAYNDEIFCLNEDGKTFVIKAGREFEIVRTNDLAEDDMSMATPAIVGDKVLLRTAARLYCLQKGAKPAARASEK